MKFLLSILIVLNGLFLFANGDPSKKAVVLKGVVNETVLGESLTGVKVSVVGSDVYTYSDRDGFFELETNTDSNIKIQFSLVSFESKVIELSPTPSGDLLHISLSEK